MQIPFFFIMLGTFQEKTKKRTVWYELRLHENKKLTDSSCEVTNVQSAFRLGSGIWCLF